MPIETLILFIPACFALNMAMGPNNLLSLTIGAGYGMRMALLGSIGRLVAFSVMIAFSALGMGALLLASETAFTLIKLAGAAYLIWLGFRLLRSDTGIEATTISPGRSTGTAGFIRQEFLVAAGNPKAILIFTAFFPQFVASSAYWQSFAVLGLIFLLLELIAIALYSYCGSRLTGIMRHARGLNRINRLSGATMILFGALLAFSRRPT